MKITFPTIVKTFFTFLIVGIFSIQLGCSANHHSNGKLIQNVSGDFRVGGFFGTSYYVKIKDNVLSYRTYSQGITSEWQKQILTAEDTEKFENKLIGLGVVNWKKEYRDPQIMDGTQWSVNYSSKKIKVKSYGSNKYPSTYKALLSYISIELLKGKPFG